MQTQAIIWCFSVIAVSGVIGTIISLAQDHYRRDQEELS